MQGDEAWACTSVMVPSAGVVLGNPQAEALALQALAPQEGQHFLDEGSGSGYLTMLAAHLAGESGRAVGVEVSTNSYQGNINAVPDIMSSSSAFVNFR